MTMRITVKNEDSSRKAQVTLREIQASGIPAPSTPVVLNPGETKEFWIYQARDMLVEEVQE